MHAEQLTDSSENLVDQTLQLGWVLTFKLCTFESDSSDKYLLTKSKSFKLWVLSFHCTCQEWISFHHLLHILSNLSLREHVNEDVTKLVVHCVLCNLVGVYGDDTILYLTLNSWRQLTLLNTYFNTCCSK